MTLDLLDKELATWQQATLAIVTNVYGLYEHPAYRTLAAGDRSAKPLSGLTKQRVEPAVCAVKDLLGLSLTLDEVIKRATELRADLPLLFQHDRLDQIEQLLTGPSIRMPDAETPPARRDLLSRGVTALSISPQQLLEVMLPAFDAARAAILAVDEVWTHLPEALEALQMEAVELEKMAAADGLSTDCDFAEVKRRIDATRAALCEDPLGAATEMEDKIRADLALLRTRLQGREAERQSVADELRAAGKSMDELVALHERADAAQTERMLKVDPAPPNSVPQVPSPDQLKALRTWHAKLQTAVKGGEWQPARIGLEKWRRAVAEARSACEEGLRAHELALSSRRELRGRLEAMKAKAAACSLAENAKLGALDREATALFLRRPTPLQETERLVAAYGRELATRTSSAR